MEIRVRIAPSPTGSPHIGTAWQALFDFVFAKKNNGKFILRLEDTDRERYVEESVGQIYETLKWLGLNYDEGPDIGGSYGPYIQSKRLDIYKKYVEELLEKDLAYQEEGAVRFKTNKSGETSWHDLVGDEQSSRGGKKISFPNNTQEDFIILKSDGFPTYNFANVVDDHLMKITHVIRGNEFISSTPKHLMIYQAFNWQPPQFAHFPVLVGSDRAKLSKRHGAKSALEFRDEGFLKEAVLNFLALLGWTHPQGKEVFDISEMIKLFDFKDVNLASAYFDIQKLEWLNGGYIRKMSDDKLIKRLQEFLVDHPAKEKIGPVVPLIKERIKKLSDFIPLTDFFWEKVEYEKEVFEKVLSSRHSDPAPSGAGEESQDLKKILGEILKQMEEMKKPWEAKDFEQTFRALSEKLGLSVTQMFQLIRVCVSGQLVTPPLFESIKILGEEESLKRVKDAKDFFDIA